MQGAEPDFQPSPAEPLEKVDAQFFQRADTFFQENHSIGLTFDDVTLATDFSNVLPKDTDLETSLSDRINLSLPIISSDMDTVTEAEMAIAMALNGGIGLIHYNMTPRQQVKEVARVKNHVHGVIQDPITVSPGLLVGDVLDLVESKGYQFRSFPVVDENGTLVGMLVGRVVRQRYHGQKVTEAMIPRAEVFAVKESELKPDPIDVADRFFDEHPGIHKLLVVDDDDRLCGLYTLSDIDRIKGEARSQIRPARDDNFRLLCGAAVSPKRTPSGQLDRDAFARHIGEMVDERLDLVAISTAHGHTEGVGESIRFIREQFPELSILAGNVTTAAGVSYLADCGADSIKIGQGPGSICTTRVVAGVGIPQMTALYAASRASRANNVRIVADGGITKSGDIVKALTLADAVICGGLLAGCQEAPGRVMEINGKLYKEYRGMGSRAAMIEGSAARYGHEAKDVNLKATAEGIEALKEVSGPVRKILLDLKGGILSGLGYLGSENLERLRAKARYIRVSPAGQREAAPHDVVEIKTGDKTL
ncbi:MAG: IMP dehydrogenase [Opitutales bacterium]|nr:IMP dehydrogenase [Opitutales bacterium]